MKSMFKHIEYIREKPHHIRKQIAFGISGVCTAVIAIIWMAFSLNTGRFALEDTSFAQYGREEVGAHAVTGIGNEQLAGVAGFLPAGNQTLDASAPARIEIVDVISPIQSPKEIEQTTIPF